MSTQPETLTGDVTVVRTSYPSGLQETTFYVPGRRGMARELLGVAEQLPDGQWVLFGETANQDRFFATQSGVEAAGARTAQLAYEAPRKGMAA